jgi:hypothetical protein
MEAPLEIRYAGVVIGRAQEVRGAEGDAPTFFIPVRDPMPVGTVLHLRAGDRETPVRVVRAVETTDAAACGMQVRTIGEAEEVARDFIPPPAAVAEKTKPATPTPVVEVDVAKMQAESATPAVAENPKANAEAPAPVAEPEAKAPEVTPEVIITVEATPEIRVVAAEPEGKVAEAGPARKAGEPAVAILDAVPVAVASSMTGALRNATESVPISEPAPEAPIVQSREPASPQVTVASAANATQEYGAVTAPEGESSGQTSGEELPPARPIAGPSGRRKTKRRK